MRCEDKNKKINNQQLEGAQNITERERTVWLDAETKKKGDILRGQKEKAQIIEEFRSFQDFSL